MKKCYSNEFLINYMIDKAGELGRIPKTSDFKAPGYRTYYIHFGTFTNALLIAGLIDEEEHKKRTAIPEKYSEEVLIAYLKQRIVELGRLPYKYELLKPTIKHYINVFGSYKRSIEKAGYQINQRNLNSEDMIEYLKQRYTELGRIPYMKDMVKYKKSIYVRYFGSWDKALKLAKIEKPLAEIKHYSREELINIFMKFYKSLGRIPKCSEVKAPSLAEYLLEFGTYEELLKICKLQYDMRAIDRGRSTCSKEYDKIFEAMKLKHVTLEDIRVLLGYEKTIDVMNRLKRHGFSNENLSKLKQYLEINKN